MAQQFVRRLIATAAVLMGVLGCTQHASAATAYGLTTTNTLIVFDTATPGTIVRTLPINFFSGVPPKRFWPSQRQETTRWLRWQAIICIRSTW